MEPKSALENPQDGDLSVNRSGAVEVESTEESIREKRAQEVADFLGSSPFYEGKKEGNGTDWHALFIDKDHLARVSTDERVGFNLNDATPGSFVLDKNNQKVKFEDWQVAGDVSGNHEHPRAHCVQWAIEYENKKNQETEGVLYDVYTPGMEYLKFLSENPDKIPQEIKKPGFNLVPMALVKDEFEWRVSAFYWDEPKQKLIFVTRAAGGYSDKDEKYINLYKKREKTV